MPEERAELVVDLSLAELVEVAQELEDVGTTAAFQRERRAVVTEVLPEGVPVTAFLVLVAAERRGRVCGCGRR